MPGGEPRAARSRNARERSSPTVRVGRSSAAISRVVFPGPQPRSTASATSDGPHRPRNRRVGDSNTVAIRLRRSAAIDESPYVYRAVIRPFQPWTDGMRPKAGANSLFGDPHRVDVDGHLRLLARQARALVLDRELLDPRGNVETLDHMAEHRVVRLRVEVVSLRSRDEEELAAARVRAGVRHRERAGPIGLLAGELVGNRVAGTAGAVAERVAALDHVDRRVEPMEVLPVEVAVPPEEHEAVHGLRSRLRVELDHDRAARR